MCGFLKNIYFGTRIKNRSLNTRIIDSIILRTRINVRAKKYNNFLIIKILDVFLERDKQIFVYDFYIFWWVNQGWKKKIDRKYIHLNVFVILSKFSHSNVNELKLMTWSISSLKFKRFTILLIQIFADNFQKIVETIKLDCFVYLCIKYLSVWNYSKIFIGYV